jgi:alanyl-tRNA synthetase
MTVITSTEIRKQFLEFFQKKEHAIIASASVVPENDATVLFNTAGMQPLVPYLLGEKHPEGKRIANCQKCIRTNDLEEVGDDTHLTFFEMLGNWSLGDYFKEESIAWAYEFLTSKNTLGIHPDYLAVTVFKGDNDAPKDMESANIWTSYDIPENRISYLGKKDNWWGPAGATGPCGPDTEIFYWVGEGNPPVDSNVEKDPLYWLEIWNNVFMEYLKDGDGNFTKAPQQNVDTGMGLERITTVLNNKKSVYDTDVFADVLSKISELSSKQYIYGQVINEENFDSQDIKIQEIKNMRIIADHIRTSVIMLSDGIHPSNIDQGYILRRLIRRAIRAGYKIGIDKDFLTDLASIVISQFENIYSQVENNKDIILQELKGEEQRFRKTLKQGLHEFEKLLKGFEIAYERSGQRITKISGEKAFKLYDTYGFPIEMTEELAKEHQLTVDTQGFTKAYEKHQEKSRVASEKKFKGGLADNSEATTQLHTATHLLHQALRNVLGNHVAQRGSNITVERLRFDFSHNQKMTNEEKEEVEKMVNAQIQQNLKISCTEMTVEDAKKQGAIGLFADKYDEKVKVYSIGKETDDMEVFSKEICGGPHAKQLSELGVFKIKKEEASSAGVRRIKAVLIS